MTTPLSETPKCANHPARDTLLRCNRCEKPICTECAILTPTGYRCKECVRSQQKVFDTARPRDFFLGILTAGVLSFLGSLIASLVGFFVILVAPAAGFVIAEAVRRVTQRRRGRLLFRLIAGAVAIGALINTIPLLLVTLMGYGNLGSMLVLLWPGIYAFIVTSTVYYRLSGIRIK